MCGICGKINTHGKAVDQQLINKMTTALSHRGPDDQGIYFSDDKKIALGHRRLSIIDLSDHGKEPMANEDKSLWLVFNGEIYNHHELRKELQNKGHRFSSQTDCETILHLFEEEGIECLKKLNGMFAFALWDTKSQSLYLCRDRIGIKPLVYSWNYQSLSFSSEIRSLLIDPDISNEIDWEALNLYFTFNYIPSPYTIYKNIRKLNPGHYLRLHKENIQIEKYWDVDTQDVSPFMDLDDAKKNLYTLMNNSVRQQMLADVPLGAFLSGGIDSSIIVGLMAKNTRSKVKTFSIGFNDMPNFDETHYSKEVAKLHQTNHTQIKLNARDIQNVFTDLLSWMDEPFADSSAIPTYIISKETRRHVKVALSGDGGDELFAGYRLYSAEYWFQRYKYIPSMLRDNFIKPLAKKIPDSRDKSSLEHFRRFKKFVLGAENNFEDRYFSWNEIINRVNRKDLLNQKSIDYNLGKNLIHKSLSAYPNDYINRMLYSDLKHSLPNDMLNKVDAMSMKNSLEVRVPILDHNIVEFAFKLNGDLKLHRGKGKYILLETFKDLLPKSLLTRKKMGFEIPIGKWLKTDLKFLLDDYLSESAIKKQGILSYEPIKNIKDDLFLNRRDTSWALWNLIVFQSWYKNNGDGHNY